MTFLHFSMAELPFFPRAVTYLFQNSKLFQQTRTTICLTGDEHRPNYNLHTTSGYHPTIYIYIQHPWYILLLLVPFQSQMFFHVTFSDSPCIPSWPWQIEVWLVSMVLSFLRGPENGRRCAADQAMVEGLRTFRRGENGGSRLEFPWVKEKWCGKPNPILGILWNIFLSGIIMNTYGIIRFDQRVF